MLYYLTIIFLLIIVPLYLWLSVKCCPFWEKYFWPSVFFRTGIVAIYDTAILYALNYCAKMLC